MESQRNVYIVAHMSRADGIFMSDMKIEGTRVLIVVIKFEKDSVDFEVFLRCLLLPQLQYLPPGDQAERAFSDRTCLTSIDVELHIAFVELQSKSMGALTPILLQGRKTEHSPQKGSLVLYIKW